MHADSCVLGTTPSPNERGGTATGPAKTGQRPKIQYRVVIINHYLSSIPIHYDQSILSPKLDQCYTRVPILRVGESCLLVEDSEPLHNIYNI